MQQSVYKIQNKSQYKHLSIKVAIATEKTAFVDFGNDLEASLTNCADQTVPDVGESDLGPHDLPVSFDTADNVSRCHFQIQFCFCLRFNS